MLYRLHKVIYCIEILLHRGHNKFNILLYCKTTQTQLLVSRLLPAKRGCGRAVRALFSFMNNINEHVHRADMLNQVMPKQAQQIIRSAIMSVQAKEWAGTRTNN